MFSPAILILTHAKMDGDKLEFLSASKAEDLVPFFRSLINENFGMYTLFCGHQVLVVNPYDAFDYVVKESCITMYRLNSMPLCLSFVNSSIPKQLITLVEAGKIHLNKHASPNFCKSRSIQDLQNLWVNWKISTIKFIIDLNKELQNSHKSNTSNTNNE